MHFSTSSPREDFNRDNKVTNKALEAPKVAGTISVEDFELVRALFLFEGRIEGLIILVTIFIGTRFV